MTLEEYLQKYVEVLEVERNLNWDKGDIILEGVSTFGKDILNKLAELSRMSSATLKIYASIASAFPKEHRYPDVPWSLYRAVYFKARKLSIDPVELLDIALSNAWSARDVARYKSQPEERTITRNCSYCDITITIRGKIKDGAIIHCPICGRDIGTVFVDEHSF